MYAGREIKYAYICEYCGHRNEKSYLIGDHIADTSNEFRGGHMITTTYLDDKKKAWLTNLLPKPDLGEISNKNYSKLNSKCSNCKKRQRWGSRILYNISFVLIAVSLLLLVLAFTECCGHRIITSHIIVVGAFLLLLTILIFLWINNDTGLFGKFMGKRVKDERNIPKIVEVGEISFSS